MEGVARVGWLGGLIGRAGSLGVGRVAIVGMWVGWLVSKLVASGVGVGVLGGWAGDYSGVWVGGLG